MEIKENFEINEFYVWKRDEEHPKLELVRQNYVFCRNETNMLLSPTEHAEVNTFCKVKRSNILPHPVYANVADYSRSNLQVLDRL